MSGCFQSSEALTSGEIHLWDREWPPQPVKPSNRGSITTNKASGGDGISAELFQILKDDAVKVLHSICQQIWKTQQWPQTGKGQFSFQSQRKDVSNNA